MCQSTEFHGFHFNSDQDSLKIKSFFIRLSKLRCGRYKKLPESLTLVYLPRINEQTGLEVSGKRIRPDSSAFVTLYWVMTAEVTEEGEGVYGSRERVTASDGVMFDVYLRDEKVLKGSFRKGEGDEWKMECKCALEWEVDNTAGGDVVRADMCVECEGHVAMVDRVDMVVKKKRNRNCRLEDIPEEGEVAEDESDVSDGCCYACGEVESGSDGEDLAELDMELEAVRWAVDVGIWVVCLGIGFLVSKASAKSLRRKRIF